MRVLLYAKHCHQFMQNKNLNSAADDCLFHHDFAHDDIEDNSDGEDRDEEGQHDARANTEQN
jgi:hypothetical protein